MATVQAVDRFFVQIRFTKSLHMSTLSSSAFTLKYLGSYETVDEASGVDLATATVVEEAFKTILPTDHYTSLTRTLDLYFADVASLQMGVYVIEVDGLKDAIGRDITVDPLYFRYRYDNSDLEEYEPEPGQPIEILDRSIKQNAFIASETISAANPDFHLTGTDPRHGDIFVAPDHRSGRITLTFSSRPSSLYVNSEYITVQRKRIGFPISRWEKLNSRIKLDSTRPRVYIAIPSIETIVEEPSDPEDPSSELIEITEPAGQFEISGLDYFEPQYKYRIRVSADFGKRVTN